MPAVSVIIPSYNHAPFLKQRIDSVINQTFQDFEIILLDDCSSDNSREIIESYRAHPRVKHIVYNPENSGSAFKQWSKGISLVKGNWIWIAESDDLSSPLFLETLVPRVSEGYDLVYCRSSTIDIQGEVLGDYFWPDEIDSQRWKSDYHNDGAFEIANYLIYRNTIPNASACLFRKDKVEDLSAVISMRFCGDWLFWINLLAKGKLYYSSQPLNLFRSHPQSTRGGKDKDKEIKRFQEYWQVIRYGREVCGKKSFGFKGIYRYEWIFNELRARQSNIGKINVLLKCLPGILIPYYFIYLFKRTRYVSIFSRSLRVKHQ